MNEMVEKVQEIVNSYEEELVKLDEFGEFFPESADFIAVKREIIEEFLDILNDLIEDCE